MNANAEPQPFPGAGLQQGATRPLVIDLDGTLLKSDMLYESFFSAVGSGRAMPVRLFREFARGRAALKQFLADGCIVDYSSLPYDAEVVAMARRARADGRKVYLATASHVSHAEAIGKHLGIFDGVFASDGLINLKGDMKAAKLVEVFGARGFDYIGNSHDDLPVWAQASKAYSVRATPSLRNKMISISTDIEHIPSTAMSARVWIKALRVHQYAKNLLLFVPMFTAHQFDLETFAYTLLGCIAFSLCASSVYLLNDLIDLKADREHLTKRRRPFASGDLPLAFEMALIPALLLAALIASAFVSLNFLLCLLGYFVLTTAYTFSLKKKMIVDVVVLAMLYTIRIVAGGIATDIAISQWLLAFSIFVFVSLALLKRYVELGTLIENNLPDPSNRNYKAADRPVVAALAAANGMNSVTIFALYLSSPSVMESYSRPWALWLICPLLIYWLGRALMMAHRLSMDDDPVIFALRDRVSRMTIACVIVIVLFAI